MSSKTVPNFFFKRRALLFPHCRLFLIVALVSVITLVASAEVLHVRVPSLPRSITDKSISEGYSEERHFTVRYKITISSYLNRATVSVYVFVRLDFTAYEDGRRLEPYKIFSEPGNLRIGRYFRVLSGPPPILYRGESTPLLRAGSVKDIRQRVLSRSVPTVGRWEIVFPTVISDRIKQTQVEINQERGIIKLTIPESAQVFKESKYSSDLNHLKYLPVCATSSSYEKTRCFFEGLYDFRKVDAVSRKEFLTGTMTPLQRKTFRKSQEYRVLLGDMERDRKTLPSKLFCFPSRLSIYSLKHKGLEIENPTFFGSFKKIHGSLRFSNLDKPKIVKSGRRPVVSRTFLKLNEEDGATLGGQTVLACFRVVKGFTYRKGRVRGSPPYASFTQGYRFLDVTLDMVYLKDQPYSVSRRGRIRKIPTH